MKCDVYEFVFEYIDEFFEQNMEEILRSLSLGITDLDVLIDDEKYKHLGLEGLKFVHITAYKNWDSLIVYLNTNYYSLNNQRYKISSKCGNFNLGLIDYGDEYKPGYSMLIPKNRMPDSISINIDSCTIISENLIDMHVLMKENKKITNCCFYTDYVCMNDSVAIDTENIYYVKNFVYDVLDIHNKNYNLLEVNRRLMNRCVNITFEFQLVKEDEFFDYLVGFDSNYLRGCDVVLYYESSLDINEKFVDNLGKTFRDVEVIV